MHVKPMMQWLSSILKLLRHMVLQAERYGALGLIKNDEN